MNPRTEEIIAGTITETTPFERGVALLDKEVPDWYEHIDLETFDITSSSHCVLGQLGGYSIMQSYLGISPKEYGFEAPAVDTDNDTLTNIDREYAKLQTLWFDAIQERQALAPQS